ncbi:glycine zipper family protein [Gordonia sp. DT30]|uniref:glycine zipper family protein n=1 Tax=unclassified Gordonia (in: high G+C Gram-positive bacteria) TaxID=2657482 RepID=UPI003CFB31B6
MSDLPHRPGLITTVSSAPTRKRLFRLLTAAVTVSVLFAPLIHGSVAEAAPPTPVRYAVSTTPGQVHLSVDNGTVERRGDDLAVVDADGTVVFRLPLTYRLEYRQFPIRAQIADKSVILTPVRDVDESVPVNPRSVDPVRTPAAQSATQSAGPKTRQERDDAALARFNQQLAAGLTISTLVGTAIGAVIGGVAGCLLGLPLAGLGCLPGIPLGASLGGVAGTIAGGGGVLIVAAIQYFQTINAPFTAPAN